MRSDSARRFFVEGKRRVGEVVEIGASDSHKISRVLRLSAGDRIEVVDSAATAFAAAIDSVEPIVHAHLLEARPSDVAVPALLTVDVAQAVPKAARMEFVVEKGTELGAGAFLPFYC